MRMSFERKLEYTTPIYLVTDEHSLGWPFHSRDLLIRMKTSTAIRAKFDSPTKAY